MHMIFKNIIIDVYKWKQSVYTVKYYLLFQEFTSKTLEYITLG
jgi:hypothetical protein